MFLQIIAAWLRLVEKFNRKMRGDASRVEVCIHLARTPKNDTIRPTVFHPIQSMTNAVKNSSSR
ncbi:MAG TPA: hypothetical protein DCW57_02825 [Planctomycetaceae bacterium]|nr:hypothetical protein [Planctomycetaceae bacterium]